MELRFRYIRDRAAVAHIWDHIDDRPDHALCGHAYQDPVELDEGRRPVRVCRGCQLLLPKAEAVLWRQLALDSAKALRKSKRDARRFESEYRTLWIDYESYATDYEVLRLDYVSLLGDYEDLSREHGSLQLTHDQLAVHADNQRQQLSRLQARSSQSPQRRPAVIPPAPTTKKTSQAKKVKKRASRKINPGRRVPSGRPRVRFVS